MSNPALGHSWDEVESEIYTPEEIAESDRRVARASRRISARSPVTRSPEEESASADAEALSSGTAVNACEDPASSDGLKREPNRVTVQIPRSLHLKLKEQAAREGVSLNQYMLYKLAQ
ncbi:MAG: toxin-antitoxin system HicB family antitoxin [Pyramidobacter sp.]|nr:toxin-antitoxin system HicB family antitoxin [Pyramidobacter sp.]MBR0108774.1 toxin-antitoxin system HicB family antitoxin [Pyramidobacter sp.]